MSEEVVATVTQFNLDGISRTVGDLLFTTERVLFSQTGGKTDVIQFLFGFIGSAIAASSSRKASVALRDRPVDEVAAEAREVHNYIDLERVTIKPRSITSSVVILQPRMGKRRKFWGKRKELQGLLSVVDRLSETGLQISVQ